VSNQTKNLRGMWLDSQELGSLNFVHVDWFYSWGTCAVTCRLLWKEGRISLLNLWCEAGRSLAVWYSFVWLVGQACSVMGQDRIMACRLCHYYPLDKSSLGSFEADVTAIRVVTTGWILYLICIRLWGFWVAYNFLDSWKASGGLILWN
jgi:hypothetical protein